GRPLLAWLYSIARNVVNSHHRAQYGKSPGPLGRILSTIAPKERAHDQPAAPDAADTSADPALSVDRWDVRDAVRLLSVNQREVIVLRYFVGLTTPEIARVLGKHERAVYSLKTRAIRALRRELE